MISSISRSELIAIRTLFAKGVSFPNFISEVVGPDRVQEFVTEFLRVQLPPDTFETVINKMMEAR